MTKQEKAILIEQLNVDLRFYQESTIKGRETFFLDRYLRLKFVAEKLGLVLEEVKTADGIVEVKEWRPA